MSDEINSRVEGLLKDALDENETSIVPRSRIETILKNIINDEEIEVVPKSRVENLLLDLKDKIANGSGSSVLENAWWMPTEFKNKLGYNYPVLTGIKLYRDDIEIPDYSFAKGYGYADVFQQIETVDCDESCKLKKMGSYAFSGLNELKKVRFVFNNLYIKTQAFQNCPKLETVLILWNKQDSSNKSKSIANTAFNNDTNLLDIYVSWDQGEVFGAPWGATNATIHYNTPLTKTLESVLGD